VLPFGVLSSCWVGCAQVERQYWELNEAALEQNEMIAAPDRKWFCLGEVAHAEPVQPQPQPSPSSSASATTAPASAPKARRLGDWTLQEFFPSAEQLSASIKYYNADVAACNIDESKLPVDPAPAPAPASASTTAPAAAVAASSAPQTAAAQPAADKKSNTKIKD
jgi:hypothetical protein